MYSFERASSSRELDFAEVVMATDTKLVRKVAARRGIGSSGLFDCFRNSLKVL